MSYRSGFAAIIGRPNVGKSTLLNQLVGQKIAIMSDKPQTTRNKIRCVLTREDAQIVFIDTPGVQRPRDRLGELMMESTTGALQGVDLILFLVEANVDPGPGDRFIMETLKKSGTPVFLVINKVDLIEKTRLLPLIDRYREQMDFAEIIPLSALKGENTTHLVDTLIKYLPEGPQYYPADMVTDHPEHFIVAELIREKVLHLTSEEIPHAIAVDVEEMKERENGKVYILATIYVERDSQRGILVGKNGSMTKKIGQSARSDIENLLGSKVFLELWVKVKKDWRNRLGILRNLGFESEQE